MLHVEMLSRTRQLDINILIFVELKQIQWIVFFARLDCLLNSGYPLLFTYEQNITTFRLARGTKQNFVHNWGLCSSNNCSV